MRPHRTPFILLILAVLGSGLVGLLLLNTTLAQGSFQVHDLKRRTAVLEEREQKLQIAVDDAGTPDNLAKAARELGLVPAKEPGFLRLTDGKVLGNPQPATSPLPVIEAPPPAIAEKQEDKEEETGETAQESEPDEGAATAVAEKKKPKNDSEPADDEAPERERNRQ